jgi:hypothetical protein
MNELHNPASPRFLWCHCPTDLPATSCTLDLNGFSLIMLVCDGTKGRVEPLTIMIPSVYANSWRFATYCGETDRIDEFSSKYPGGMENNKPLPLRAFCSIAQ